MNGAVTIVQRPIDRIVIRRGAPIRVVPKPVSRVVVSQSGSKGPEGDPGPPGPPGPEGPPGETELPDIIHGGFF